MNTTLTARLLSSVDVDTRVKAVDWVSANLRHGVSRLWSGHRHTVGVIFHDAK